MLNFKRLFLNKTVRFVLIVAAFLILVYIVLRLTIFPSDPVVPLLNSLYKIYLFVPEAIANLLFKAGDANVFIQEHQLIFHKINNEAYHNIYSEFIENYPKYFLHKRWSGLLLIFIWATFPTIRKKVLLSFLFLMVHLITVTSELYFIGVIYPGIFDYKEEIIISPTSFGNIILFIFFVILMILNKQKIKNIPKELKINVIISDRRITEMIILLSFFFVLREIILQVVHFHSYRWFLLEITRRILSAFNYSGYITENQLIGENGGLFLGRPCLGLMTMFIYASMIYLTRPQKSRRITSLFMSLGLLFLFILNIFRLAGVFIISQGENGFERASRHHEIYNIVIYIIVFVIWIIWFEILFRKTERKEAE